MNWKINCVLLTIILVVWLSFPVIVSHQKDSVQRVSIGVGKNSNDQEEIVLYVEGSIDGCVTILRPLRGDAFDYNLGDAGMLPIVNAQTSEIRKLLDDPNGINKFSSATGKIEIDARSENLIIKGDYHSKSNFFPIRFAVIIK